MIFRAHYITNVTPLRLRFDLYYLFWRVIPILASIGEPLNCRLDQHLSFHFGWLNYYEIGAFKTLQYGLLSPLILASKLPSEQYNIDTSACHQQFQCVLSQKQTQGRAKSGRYWSGSLHMECTRQKAEWVSDWRMSHPTAEIVSPSVAVYYLNGPRCASALALLYKLVIYTNPRGFICNFGKTRIVWIILH